MPTPLKPDHCFDITYTYTEESFVMKSPEMCRDFYEIGYIIQGDRACITENKAVIMHAGDVGVTNINIFYKTTSLSSAPYEKILIKFKPSVVAPLIKTMGQNAFDTFISCPAYCFKPEISHLIEKLFREMYEEFIRDARCSEILLQGMLFKLILTIMRCHLVYPANELTSSYTPHTIIAALNYIESNYQNDPSLESTAASIHLTPFYFSKLFKETTGLTYSAYLNHVKYQHVRLLLTNTSMSMEEVAEKCGFSTRNYMCQVFKQIEGRTPNQFRKAYKA